MKILLRISILSTLLSFLPGCQTQDAYSGEDKQASATTGAIIGGVAGAVLGNQVKGSKNTRLGARIAGAGLGALVGGKVGQNMDDEETALRKKLQNTGVSVRRDGDRLLLNMPGAISFDSGRSTIKDSFMPVLQSVAEVINHYDDTTVEIAGHTDSQGNNADNQILSEQRANGVSQALRQYKVQGNRIVARGFGESQPVATNDNDSGRQTNRRVEISLSPIAH